MLLLEDVGHFRMLLPKTQRMHFAWKTIVTITKENTITKAAATAVEGRSENTQTIDRVEKGEKGR